MLVIVLVAVLLMGGGSSSSRTPSSTAPQPTPQPRQTDAGDVLTVLVDAGKKVYQAYLDGQKKQTDGTTSEH